MMNIKSLNINSKLQLLQYRYRLILIYMLTIFLHFVTRTGIVTVLHVMCTWYVRRIYVRRINDGRCMYCIMEPMERTKNYVAIATVRSG